MLNNTANGSFSEMETRRVPVRKSQYGFEMPSRQSTAGPYPGTCYTMQGHHGDRLLLAWSRPSHSRVPKSFSLLGRTGRGLGKDANGMILAVSDLPSVELLPTRGRGEMRGKCLTEGHLALQPSAEAKLMLVSSLL